MARVSIEDCLNHIENRFALVTVASHRTRQLMAGKTPLVKTKNKEAVTALREIAEGLVVSDKTSSEAKVQKLSAVPDEAIEVDQQAAAESESVEQATGASDASEEPNTSN